MPNPMTIDERLEALTARHEALSESVELLTRDVQELRVSADRLLATAREDGQNIRALARIAELHSQRIERLENRA